MHARFGKPLAVERELVEVRFAVLITQAYRLEVRSKVQVTQVLELPAELLSAPADASLAQGRRAEVGTFQVLTLAEGRADKGTRSGGHASSRKGCACD